MQAGRWNQRAKKMINEDRRLRRCDPNAPGVGLMAFGAEGIISVAAHVTAQRRHR
jgi:hypothetical protein